MTDARSELRQALPYVLPMAGFLVMTAVEGYLPSTGGRPSPLWYPLAYTAKVAVVAGLAWGCRSSWRDLAPRPGPKWLALAVVIGLLVALAWVGLEGWYPELPMLGKRTGFDPSVLPVPAHWAFVTVRLFGLVLLVPLVEELFWRSFLMRWVIDADFMRVPVGRMTASAVLVTSILFGFAHPEWLPALLTGLAWAWLVWRTKSVSACVVSHAAANLALGVYVLSTGDWKYW
jgi:CAAX prenyl protease-like protein